MMSQKFPPKSTPWLQKFEKFDALQLDRTQANTSRPMPSNNVNGSFSPSPSSRPAPSQGVFSDGSGVGIPLASSGGFFRIPDATKLFANTHQGSKVALGAFHSAFVVLAKDVNLSEDDFVITGDELDSRFEIQFEGEDPSRSARSLYQSLYLGKGIWKEQKVGVPSGLVQFFVNPDKNNVQIRKEIITKRFAQFLEPHVGGAKPVKLSGVVLAGKKRLASIVIKDEVEYDVVWYPSIVESVKIDSVALWNSFKAEMGLSL